MNSPEIALFLWINADPQTPAAVVLLAQLASQYLPGIAIVSLVLAASVRPQLRRVAVQAVVAMLLAWMAARLLRHGLDMPRPAALGLGRQWIDHAGGPGLPSLHAAGAFAFCCSLWLAAVPRTLAAAGLLVAALIAWSRLCLGVHFPMDVLTGAAVGLICARVAQQALDLPMSRILRRVAGWRPRTASVRTAAQPPLS